MPTPLAHSFCGFLFYPEAKERLFKSKVYAGSFIVFMSCFPDLDYFVGIWSGDLKMGHRVFTHSLFFPLIIGVLIGFLAKFFKRKFTPFFIITVVLIGIHILLDYLTFDNYPPNGIGVPLFWPLSSQCFTFPFHPFANWFAESYNELISAVITDFYFMVIFFGLMLGRKRLQP